MGFYILSYLCIAVFALATAYRIYRQFSLPVHVRWEIYPVQHEPAAKVAYGGSYMEEIDWWEKKREQSLLSELRYMVPEILFIRGLWKENRCLWLVSFPFHFGLYLMIATSCCSWSMPASPFRERPSLPPAPLLGRSWTVLSPSWDGWA